MDPFQKYGFRSALEPEVAKDPEGIPTVGSGSIGDRLIMAEDPVTWIEPLTSKANWGFTMFMPILPLAEPENGRLVTLL